MKVMLTVFAMLASTGCASEPISEPSFQVDILPLVAANCARCHGDPALGGAPSWFRLDAYEDLDLTPEPDATPCGVSTCGARSMANLAALRVRDTIYPMPPRKPLDDEQRDPFVRWALRPERAAREGNSVPTVELLDASATGDTVAISLHVDDADDDLVSGHVRLRDPGGIDHVIGAVRSGRVSLTSTVGAGVHELAATLDDGGSVFEVALGTITVPAR